MGEFFTLSNFDGNLKVYPDNKFKCVSTNSRRFHSFGLSVEKEHPLVMKRTLAGGVSPLVEPGWQKVKHNLFEQIHCYVSLPACKLWEIDNIN